MLRQCAHVLAWVFFVVVVLCVLALIALEAPLILMTPCVMVMTAAACLVDLTSGKPRTYDDD